MEARLLAQGVQEREAPGPDPAAVAAVGPSRHATDSDSRRL